MRGGKGEEDNPSKGHKALRLSFRARAMAAETVWKSLFFFFFNLKDLLNAVDQSQLFLLRLINVRFHEALRNKKNSFTLCLFFTSSAERVLPYKRL